MARSLKKRSVKILCSPFYDTAFFEVGTKFKFIIYIFYKNILLQALLYRRINIKLPPQARKAVQLR